MHPSSKQVQKLYSPILVDGDDSSTMSGKLDQIATFTRHSARVDDQLPKSTASNLERILTLRQKALEVVGKSIFISYRQTSSTYNYLSELESIERSIVNPGFDITMKPGSAINSLYASIFDLVVILKLRGLRLQDNHEWIIRLGDIKSMHSDVAQLFRQEARRQTVVASQIVHDMLKMPTSYIPELAEDGGVDQAGLKQLLDLLKTEQIKLDTNEATIAVVGAMKAGKSTTINAIVGSEVLPSREQPMTTFPTIVTHAPGKGEGHLRFPLAPAFLELAGNVKTAISALGDDAEERLARAAAAEPLRLLAAKIKAEDFAIAGEVVGLEEIRSLLGKVNDLTRLARLLEVPDDCISDALRFATLPRIEIEFEHLVSTPGVFSGTLSLVDTPGPDEFGSSEALERIAKQQLKDASAIILVVNFNQVGSEADEKIKKLLGLLPHGSSERLFIFINKFDGAKKHGDNLTREQRREAEERRIDEYKSMTARQIIEIIGEGDLELLKSRTFPTTADMALLSNQARRAVRLEGRLDNRFAWVENFADRRLPEWEANPEILATPDRLKQAIDGGWELSRFGEPLEKAISYSAENASKLLVLACLDKMREEMSQVYQRLGLGRNALEADTAVLIGTMHELNSDLANIDKIKEKNDSRLQAIGEDLWNQIDQYQKDVSEAIRNTIYTYTQVGKGAEAKKAHDTTRMISINSFRQVQKYLSQKIWGEEGNNSILSPEDEKILSSKVGLLKFPDISITDHPVTGNRCIKLLGTNEARWMVESIFSSFEELLQQGFATILTARDLATARVVTDTRHAVQVSFEESWKKVQDRIQEVLKYELKNPTWIIQLITPIL